MDQPAELRRLTEQFYEMFNSGDATMAESHVADDALVIGTDPSEWWSGREEVMRALRAQTKELAEAGVRVEGGDVVAAATSDVGWVADRPRFVMPDGTTVPARITAVFRREGGDWKIAQWHASLGVANEEAVGRELTL